MKNSTRKAPTEEQKAAAKERRAQIAKMMGTIKAMPEEQRILLAARFGIRNAEGRELSVYNQCLLIAQNDKVTVVGGFSQWKKLGRSVKKGSRALAIWVPCSRKADSSGSAIVPHGVDPSDLDESFFVLGNVFDISQTETEEEKIAREGDEALEAAARPKLPTSEALDVEASEVTETPALTNGPADYLADTGNRWSEATPDERAAYLAATEQEINPPAEVIEAPAAPVLTIWDVEEPAPGQRLLICPPPAPERKAPPATEPEVMPTLQDEFELLAA